MCLTLISLALCYNYFLNTLADKLKLEWLDTVRGPLSRRLASLLKEVGYQLYRVGFHVKR
jgi:hypothetical protein